jgi:hypothetical protein
MLFAARSPGPCLLALFAAFAAGCGGSPSATTDGTTSTSGASNGGAGGASSGGASSGGASSGGSTATGSVDPPFVLEAHTSVTPEHGLALTTNLPATTADCGAAPFEGTPCEDLDQDGLADAWEDLVIERYRPLLRFDEAESLVGDAAFVVHDVARVALVAPSPLRARVFIMLGYSKDFGSCGFTSHNGDSERVALDLAAPAGGGPGDVTAVGFYTAAHENTASDHSMKLEGAGLADLVFEDDSATGEPRWVVFPSQDKHGTYASIDICENISAVPCLDEDCGPDGAANPAEYDRLPPFVNAGEEAHPLVSDLTAIGFPGDDAWADQDFCGGLGGSTCSAPVREKLLPDPFGP